jgi:DNA-binding transcriptional LysR family regulator
VGRRFTAELQRAFGQITTALESPNSFRGTRFGIVRINASIFTAPFVLHDVIAPLVKQNPVL